MMLKIQNVKMNFGKKPVLQGINLQIESGVFGLLGPNGSGKTTLMRCITGILTPAQGTIQKPKKIGYLPQKFGMFKQLTVYETLEYFASLKNVSKNQQSDMIYKCLQAVNLEERASDRIGTLSGGMIRRVGIAQALLGDPDLILFHNLISRIEKEKIVIISTHIVEDVADNCDHIIILSRGKVITQSTTDELRDSAMGKVYAVPFERSGELSEPYILLREDAAAKTLRVLSDFIQPGELVPPSIEDGYISHIRRKI